MQNIDCGETNVTWTSKNYFKPRHYKNCYLSCKLQFYYEQFIALNFPIIWHNDDRTNFEVKMKSFAFSNFLIKSGATDSIDVSRTSIKSLIFLLTSFPSWLKLIGMLASASVARLGDFRKLVASKNATKTSPNIWWLFGHVYTTLIFGTNYCSPFLGQLLETFELLFISSSGHTACYSGGGQYVGFTQRTRCSVSISLNDCACF